MVHFDKNPEGMDGELLSTWQGMVDSMNSMFESGKKHRFTVDVDPANRSARFSLAAQGIFVQLKCGVGPA